MDSGPDTTVREANSGAQNDGKNTKVMIMRSTESTDNNKKQKVNVNGTECGRDNASDSSKSLQEDTSEGRYIDEDCRDMTKETIVRNEWENLLQELVVWHSCIGMGKKGSDLPSEV